MRRHLPRQPTAPLRTPSPAIAAAAATAATATTATTPAAAATAAATKAAAAAAAEAATATEATTPSRRTVTARRAAVATPEATAAAAAAAARTIVSDADVDGAAVEIGLIEPIDRGLSDRFVCDLDKAEAARAPGLPVDDDVGAEHRAELGKRLLELVIHGGVGQVPNKQLRAHRVSMPRCFLTRVFGSDGRAARGRQPLARRGGRQTDPSRADRRGTRSASYGVHW